MHEGNFTEEIVGAVLAQLALHPGRRPSRVKVRVGESFHLEADSVRDHFKRLTVGTDLARAELVLEEEPVMVQCRRCGGRGPVEDHHWPECKACGSLETDVVAGNEVVVDSIVLEERIGSSSGR
jgi:hydrogenase nickel incorporation protein HypA/HybF